MVNEPSVFELLRFNCISNLSTTVTFLQQPVLYVPMGSFCREVELYVFGRKNIPQNYHQIFLLNNSSEQCKAILMSTHMSHLETDIIYHFQYTRYNTFFDQKLLILVLLNPDMPCLCKQCRSTPDSFSVYSARQGLNFIFLYENTRPWGYKTFFMLISV